MCVVKKLVIFFKNNKFLYFQKNYIFVIKTAMLGSKARMHFDQSTPMPIYILQ